MRIKNWKLLIGEKHQPEAIDFEIPKATLFDENIFHFCDLLQYD